MKLFKATVKEDFGEYKFGQTINLIPAEGYYKYYWILHPVTRKTTTNAVNDSLLLGREEITKAA